MTKIYGVFVKMANNEKQQKSEEQTKSDIDKQIAEYREKLKELRMLKKGNFVLFYNKIRKGVLEISKQDKNDKEKNEDLKVLLNKTLEEIKQQEQQTKSGEQ